MLAVMVFTHGSQVNFGYLEQALAISMSTYTKNSFACDVPKNLPPQPPVVARLALAAVVFKAINGVEKKAK